LNGKAISKVIGYGMILKMIRDKCKGNLTNLRRELHLSLAKGNPKRTL
jgi:hypothetical protein